MRAVISGDLKNIPVDWLSEFAFPDSGAAVEIAQRKVFVARDITCVDSVWRQEYDALSILHIVISCLRTAFRSIFCKQP